MNQFTGVKRAAQQVWSDAQAGLRRLDLQRRATVGSGNASARARRAGRWLVIRGLASAAFRPGRWGAGLAVAGLAVPGPWWLASIAIVPISLPKTLSILTRSDHRSFVILSAVSRRVKSLKLRRRLVRGWTPLMVRLGLSRQVERRRLTRQLRFESRTETVAPQLGRITLSEWGLNVPVNLQPLDLPVRKLREFAEHIESGLAVPDCTLRKVGPGRAIMDLRHTDPLAETVRVADLPAPKRYLHVVTQIAADSSGVEQPLPPLDLTVGATRAGKSNRSWVLVKLILDEGIPLRLRVFDPRRQEFAALADAAYDYEADLTRWPEFLGRAYAALRSRQSSLAKRGIKELRSFTERDPLDLMILDEFLSVLAMRNTDVKVGSQTMRAHAVLDQYASQCLAAGYGMAAAAQLGQKEIIGAVRDLFPTSTCLRVPPQASEMVNAVLGPGAAATYPAHEIPFGRHTAGQGYTRTPTGIVLRTRGAFLTDDERADVVTRLRAETDRFGGPYRQRRKQQREPVEAAT